MTIEIYSMLVASGLAGALMGLFVGLRIQPKNEVVYRWSKPIV